MKKYYVSYLSLVDLGSFLCEQCGKRVNEIENLLLFSLIQSLKGERVERQENIMHVHIKREIYLNKFIMPKNDINNRKVSC